MAARRVEGLPGGLAVAAAPGCGHATDQIVKEIPFSAPVRPFTVNGSSTLAYVNVKGAARASRSGTFATGKFLHRVEVPGYQEGPREAPRLSGPRRGSDARREGVWVVDGFNKAVHVYDNHGDAAEILQTIAPLIDDPGWVTFTLSGDYRYPSTGT
jgi:hypothetical protein